MPGGGEMTVRGDSAEVTRQVQGMSDRWHEAQVKWRDMSRWQQAAVATLAVTEIVLTTRAALDLARRNSAAVRGPKVLWWPVLTVQPFGPVAYLKWGRLR
jgi:hypothetical protein